MFKYDNKVEPLSIKASEADWTLILNKLSDETLMKILDDTKYLLESQDQENEDS